MECCSFYVLLKDTKYMDNERKTERKKERKKAAVYVIECLGNAREWNKKKKKKRARNEMKVHTKMKMGA